MSTLAALSGGLATMREDPFTRDEGTLEREIELRRDGWIGEHSY